MRRPGAPIVVTLTALLWSGFAQAGPLRASGGGGMRWNFGGGGAPRNVQAAAAMRNAQRSQNVGLRPSAPRPLSLEGGHGVSPSAATAAARQRLAERAGLGAMPRRTATPAGRPAATTRAQTGGPGSHLPAPVPVPDRMGRAHRGAGAGKVLGFIGGGFVRGARIVVGTPLSIGGRVLTGVTRVVRGVGTFAAALGVGAGAGLAGAGAAGPIGAIAGGVIGGAIGGGVAHAILTIPVLFSRAVYKIGDKILGA